MLLGCLAPVGLSAVLAMDVDSTAAGVDVVFMAVGESRAVIVVPCYNESARLEPAAFVRAASELGCVRFVFVDDGSTDDTRDLLTGLCDQNPDICELVAFDVNRGKAEAVRSGILHGARSQPEFVGYWDADLATPLEEIPHFIAVFDERPQIEIVLGARVNLLGHSVRRRLVRHYMGRVFATMVAFGLKLPVYDTQCGAKMFRCSSEVLALFEEPFLATWVFDAELLARAIDRHESHGVARVMRTTYELPLQRWSEVDGTSLKMRHLVGAARDSVRIFGRHSVTGRWRKGTGGLTYKLAVTVRDVLSRLAIADTSVAAPRRFWRAVATVPVYGGFVLWTRLRSWLSGPVAYVAETSVGTQFVCRIPDLVQTYIFMFGVWEPDLTAFIARRVEPGRTFIDVGANIGYHTLVAATAEERGRVVAIEASPSICSHLRESLDLNGSPDNVTVVNRAVSDHAGKLTLYKGPVHNTGLTTSVPRHGYVEEGSVECAPLHELLSEEDITTARLVKIDVEGAEGAVLAGMERFLEMCPADVEIVVELSPRWWSDRDRSPIDLLQPFFDAGFHAYELDNNLWPWRYLWPASVAAPRRSRRNFARKPRRIELVLSRADAAVL
jgi:FkbM family methyltransferase